MYTYTRKRHYIVLYSGWSCMCVYSILYIYSRFPFIIYIYILQRSRLSASVWGNTVQRLFNHSVCVRRSVRSVMGDRRSRDWGKWYSEEYKRYGACTRWYIYTAVELNNIGVVGGRRGGVRKNERKKGRKLKRKTLYRRYL